MGASSIVSCASLAALVLIAAISTQGCATPYGDEESPTQDSSAASAVSGRTCAAAEVRVRDDFEGRTKASSAGWSKGRVSDGLPAITTPSSKTTAVLTSKVAAATDEDAKTTAYIEREVQASGCIAAELDVSYSEEAAFPADAWTYFFWIDGADDMNISLFRRANYVRLAAQRGGSELERVDVELPPDKWSRIHVELDLDTARPVMSISVGKSPAKKVTLAEPVDAPYFVSVGTWSRGAVPAHQFLFDNVKLWY